ncbi:heterogeneous nuclear ribonucleoprotein U-like protein 2 [Dendroctonus ponderosae]|uniref:SAP domain-containing protein n=1 Tax=Dendroctonus ponderosae TaxID=77166 RepID=A0AAR5NZI1_DENPD|nr:heterogeneous nuclear ribonucleoprotein U-like protein 2 [Dendroctonus ponderosae]
MDPEKLKVVDLRKELQQRCLDTKGNKAVLVKRLKEALDAEAGKGKPIKTDPSEITDSIQHELTVKVEPLKDPKTPKKTPLKDTPTTTVKTPVATPEKSVIEPVIKSEELITPEKDIKVELQTPLPITQNVKEVSKTPEKVVKLEPQTPAPLATAIQVETSTDQQPENVDDQEVVEESVAMETETRGEKRKREDDDEDVESIEKKRREDSPVKSPEKPLDQSSSKPEVKSPPIVEALKIPIKEDEPEIDYEKPQLSWFDSDLHLNIDKETFLSAKPLNDGCFGYIWAGARATHGISSGKICFEVKITEELKWDDMTEKMLDKSVVKDKYKIDRRKDKDQPKLTDTKNDTEKQEEDKPKEDVPDDTQTEELSKDEKEQNGDCNETKEETSNNDLKSETAEPSDEVSKDAEKTEESKDEVAQVEQAASEVTKFEPIPSHYFRVGFSLAGTSLQLGEAPHSFAYESTGRFVTNNDYQEYGSTFGIGDVVGAYLSIDNENAIITFTVNGIAQPTAITVPRSEFPEDLALFPHVLCRNYAYELNFGANETPWFPHPEELKDYEFLQDVQDKVSGPKRPDKREECEVILMIGLPGSGKTHWVKNYLESNPDKKYTIIGNNALFDRMTVDGQTLKSRFNGSWKILVDRAQKCLNLLTDKGSLRRRNYIIDQTNLFPNAQRRKLRSFEGFKRKAVIVVCEDDEHARRQKDQQNDFGKIVPESTMYDLKAQMEIPQTCEWIDEMIFTDLDEEEARKKVKAYNEEASKKGYFRRWQNNRRPQQRSFRLGDRRGGFPGSRFERYPPGRGGFNRPAPYPGRRDLRPSRPTHINPWRHHPRGPRLPDATRNRENRNSGFGGVRNQSALRNQGARNAGVWQNSAGGSNNWGSGHQGGWNSSMYQGFNSAWNDANTANQQSAWKYGGNQSGYNNSGRYGNQANYGNYQGYQGSHQGYGAQIGYGSNQGGYGSQGNYGGQQGYGQQNWNYGPYGQQQGWGSQKRK